MGEDLNKLRDRACRCAREHGFHDKDNSDEYFIALVMTELAEAIDADRKGKKPLSRQRQLSQPHSYSLFIQLI